MITEVMTRSDLLLMLDDVVAFRELICDVVCDFQDWGLLAFAFSDDRQQVLGIQFLLGAADL